MRARAHDEGSSGTRRGRSRGVWNGTHDDGRLGAAHAATLFVLVIGLVIDTMKPATLGFVLPCIMREYDVAQSQNENLSRDSRLPKTHGTLRSANRRAEFPAT